MNVFLTGATGYVGSVVAEKLQGTGHQVVGLARSDTAAAKLHERGITVHRGDLSDVASLIAGAQQADAVIHAAFSGEDQASGSTLDLAATEAILNGLEGSNKPFIYTSGLGVYGNTGNDEVTEDTPPQPWPFLAWRPPIEQLVLSAADRGVRGIVLRPPLVYGRGGSGFIHMLIGMAQQAGAAYYIGDGENVGSQAHVDDLADLYVHVLEQAPARIIVNAAGPLETMKNMMRGIAYAAGLEGKTESMPIETARQVMGPIADVLVANLNISGRKAREQFGWQPKMPSMVEDLSHGSYRDRAPQTHNS